MGIRSDHLEPSDATRFVNALCGRIRARRGVAIPDCEIARGIMEISPSTLSNWTSGRHPAGQLEAAIRLMRELPPEEVVAVLRGLPSPPERSK